MLKKSLFITLCLVMAFSLSAFAGEGSDTVGGGKLLPQLRYGYSSTDWETHSADAIGFTDWDVSAHTYYAQVNWGILNNVDLIALVGGRSLCMESDFFQPTALFWDAETNTVPMFMWGLGVKGTFFRADNGFYVGGGALFTHSFSSDLNVETVLNGALVADDDGTLDVYMLVPEVHAGWRIKDTGLTPYVGADYVWSRSVVELDDGSEIIHRLDNPFFMFAGIDYFLNDKLYINVEGRTNFVDGWGVESGVGYLFDICATPPPPPPPPPVIEPKLEPMSKN